MHDVSGFEGQYAVTKNGNVWSYKNQRLLKPIVAANGYLKVNLSSKGKFKAFYIHRLVAQAYIANPDNRTECNHIDGDKTNNKIGNLEWVTRKENIKHSFKELQRQPVRGHKHGMSKLNKADILKIRELLGRGELSQKDISILFKISENTVSAIKLKKVWAWT